MKWVFLWITFLGLFSPFATLPVQGLYPADEIQSESVDSNLNNANVVVENVKNKDDDGLQTAETGWFRRNMGSGWGGGNWGHYGSGGFGGFGGYGNYGLGGYGLGNYGNGGYGNGGWGGYGGTNGNIGWPNYVG